MQVRYLLWILAYSSKSTCIIIKYLDFIFLGKESNISKVINMLEFVRMLITDLNIIHTNDNKCNIAHTMQDLLSNT